MRLRTPQVPCRLRLFPGQVATGVGPPGAGRRGDRSSTDTGFAQETAIGSAHNLSRHVCGVRKLFGEALGNCSLGHIAFVFQARHEGGSNADQHDKRDSQDAADGAVTLDQLDEAGEGAVGFGGHGAAFAIEIDVCARELTSG